MNTIKIYASGQRTPIVQVDNPTKEQLLAVANYYRLNRHSYKDENDYLKELLVQFPQLKDFDALHIKEVQPLTENDYLAVALEFRVTMSLGGHSICVKQFSCLIGYYDRGALYDVLFNEPFTQDKFFNVIFSVKFHSLITANFKDLVEVIYPAQQNDLESFSKVKAQTNQALDKLNGAATSLDEYYQGLLDLAKSVKQNQ